MPQRCAKLGVKEHKEMASYKAIPHTDYGKAHARRDATWDHRNGHVDGRDVQHIDPDCHLCMADYWLAKRQQQA